MRNPLLRYVARLVLGYIALATLAGAVLYLVVDFVEVGNLATERGQSQLVSRLTWINLPRVLRMMLPIAAPVGAIAGLGTLMRRRELVALMATGAAPTVLLRPLAFAGAIVAALHAANVEWLVPPASVEVATLRRQIGMAPGPLESATRKQSWFRGEALAYRVSGLRRTDGARADGVLMLALADGRLEARWDVPSMEFDARTGAWSGTDVLERHFDGETSLRTTTATRATLPIQERPEDFVVSIASPERLGLRALWATAEARERLGRPSRAHRLEAHQRLGIPAAIILAVVGAAGLALRLGRRQTLARALGFGALIGVSVWTISDFSVLLGLTGTAPAWLAAYALPAATLGLALAVWRRVARVGIRDRD